MSESHTLTETDLVQLVDRFYDKVRRDPELGPVFNPAVHDWDEHKATLVNFWSSVALKTGRYRGNPMAMHRPHPIDAAHFDHWLELWRETTLEVTDPGNARVLLDHAERIGRSLKYGLGLDGQRRPIGLPLA